MSTIEELMREVEVAGMILRADPPDLVVRPADRLTPELEARLIQHKTELLRRLELEASSIVVQEDGLMLVAKPADHLTIIDLLPYAPLTLAECSTCRRRYYWRVVPQRCSWPNCNGELGKVKP